MYYIWLYRLGIKFFLLSTCGLFNSLFLEQENQVQVQDQTK